MHRFVCALVAVILVTVPVFAQKGGGGKGGGSVSVSGYTRSNGTHVSGYTRSAPGGKGGSAG
jgi:hypothetical protein